MNTIPSRNDFGTLLKPGALSVEVEVWKRVLQSLFEKPESA
jgi:hypothetical protein